MRWLYRLQARAGLAGPEGTAALVVLVALAGGLVAQHLWATSEPVPAEFYAAADAAFAAAAPPAGEGEPAAPAPLALAEPAATAPPADSTAADVADAEVAAAAAPRRTGKPPPAPTNINTATEAELQRLPGIGPALAARVVAHREANGPFQRPEQITDVKGIGEKTFEKMSPWIRL
jgi:competence protein ComEA